MTIQTANAIVQKLGPCTIHLDSARDMRLAIELSLLGCEVRTLPGASAPGRSAGFLDWTRPAAGDDFGAAIRSFAGMDALILHSAGQDRALMEEALFRAGWGRHPGGMTAHDYPAWSYHHLPALSFYLRRAGTGAGTGLLAGGMEADARIARYAAAAQHVRSGDHVLVDGTAAADGAAILNALSRAGEILIAGEGPCPVDQSIDLVVALDPAVPAGWRARLDDFARLLKPDGRVVVGFHTGHDELAEPYDWTEFSGEMAARFLGEKRYVERAATGDPDGPHSIVPAAADCADESDWLMLVASANPLMGEGQGAAYDHPAYPRAKGPLPALVDFGAAYDNPFLYRSMVQMGERIADDMTLSRLAECIVEDSRPDSADRGAALAVLGYRVLEARMADLVPSLLPLIAAYVALPDDMPVHVSRWRLSLAFLAGRLTELAGDRRAAKDWYRTAAEGRWEAFSPLLATKAIAASFYAARIHLSEGDAQSALACFRQGSDTALRAAAFPHASQADADGQPLPFYLQELAEVIDMGSQCANALAHFHLWERDPGLFWRQVDIRRFGLASWARDLEQENARLRAA